MTLRQLDIAVVQPLLTCVDARATRVQILNFGRKVEQLTIAPYRLLQQCQLVRRGERGNALIVVSTLSDGKQV